MKAVLRPVALQETVSLCINSIVMIKTKCGGRDMLKRLAMCLALPAMLLAAGVMEARAQEFTVG